MFEGWQEVIDREQTETIVVNIDDIQKFFHGRVALSEPLGKYTSFRIGGPADFYLEPAGREDVIKMVTYLQQRRIPFMMMGKGSNMLVNDQGVRGAVVNLEEGLNGISMDGEFVNVEAGLAMARFVDFCIQQGLAGVEMLPGIPGTIGGAIMMNAGAYGGEIADHLVDVEALRDGRVVRIVKADAGFGYRKSGFQGDVILAARFRLPRADKAELMKQRRELLLKRNRTQPINFPNSGSMFKNPPERHAAKLIEDAGLKGTREGKAQISERHANFIVNHGGATADDVFRLMKLARAKVLEKFGIMLEPEVKLIGFSEQEYRQVYS